MRMGLSDLPEEVRAAIAPHMAESAETLAAIGIAIAKRRDDAKAARTSSGIEAVWKEAEEAYIGIDDSNRHEYQDARWSKPMSMDGPVTTGKTPKPNEHKSTAFVRLTARYVDAGSAKLGEILLPADDKAFKFSEMPVPELIEAKDDQSHVLHSEIGNAPLMRPVKPGETVPGSTTPAPAAVAGQGGAVPVPGAAAVPPAPGMPPGPLPVQEVPLTVKDLAEENIELARKAAKSAETRIYGWMIECQRTAEMRKIIDDSARIGVGVLNGPIPVRKKGIAVDKDKDVLKVIFEEKIVPASRWRDPWNIFPDPACGENIHNGDFIFDRDFLSPRQVRELKELPGYISSQIDAVLKEGPDGPDKDTDMGVRNTNVQAEIKGRFEVWYYYGSLKKSEMGAIWTAAGKKLDDLPADKAEVYAIVTLINQRVVRATINPLDSGSFPYHSVPWQRRAGHWAGIGVAEQIKMPQKLINQATRAMINNAAKSAGSQIVIDRGVINPANGSWLLEPDKIWNKTADTGGSVDDAFAMHEIPNHTDELMKIVEYALRLAEESTSIPLITQGMSGETQPETLGGMTLQNSNANQLLRSIGYAFDDHITEPEVRQYYEWLLLAPDVPDEEKGAFTIDAHGSVALVERAIQDQTIAQMGAFAKDPAYGIDPKRWMKMFMKSKRLDPVDFQFSEEEQKKIDAAPPPVAPQVQAAQIRAQTDTAKIASDKETKENATVVGHIGHMSELAERRELALLDYANANRMKITDVRAMLADTAMKLDVQKELSHTSHLVDLKKHGTDTATERSVQAAEPAVEPAGRAAPGKAFEQ